MEIYGFPYGVRVVEPGLEDRGRPYKAREQRFKLRPHRFGGMGGHARGVALANVSAALAPHHVPFHLFDIVCFRMPASGVGVDSL